MTASMKPDSFHLAAGDGDEDFRADGALSTSAPSAYARMTRIAVVCAAAAFPTLAVMFCSGRTDLMAAPVMVRFNLLVLTVVCAIAATALTDRGQS